MIFAAIMIPKLLIERAIHSVLQIFRDKGAITNKNAMTIDELGLKPGVFMDRFYRLRDYKPYALQILIGSNVIQMTGDGKLFLSEQELASSKWKED